MSGLFSRSLVMVGVLLAPLQALQVTPLLCQLTAGCSAAEASCADDAMCPHGMCPPPARGGSAIDVEGLEHLCLTLESPAVPRECPPNCWCRHPAQPQPLPVQPLELVSSLELASHRLCEFQPADGPQVVGLAANRDLLPPYTAQQVCASLCRFLA